MQYESGILRKMQAELTSPVSYHLCLSQQLIPLNVQIGQQIKLTFSGNIHCIQCARKIKKSFQQGYCYPCYQRLLECHLCIIHPERCLVEQGNCPEDDWAHRQCHQDHIIYLANTSGLKVGITRASQIPTRWIDQGAVQAVALMKVNNRRRAGVLEVAMKRFIADKTNWRVMLKNTVERLDLDAEKQSLLDTVRDALIDASQDFSGEFEYIDADSVMIEYPVLSYPQKLISLSLDKTPCIEGQLLGIKGQYWILDVGVINMRKFGGYELVVGLS